MSVPGTLDPGAAVVDPPAPAVEPHVKLKDPFLEAVRGRVPLSKNIGAARTWVPTKEPSLSGDAKEDTGPYVPRPDVSLGWLRFMSLIPGLFGLDHFFLRSPTTGMIKLALGLICAFYIGFSNLPKHVNWAIPFVLLIWWAWDNIQVWTEGDRIINYGLSAPFDLLTGIGQGMITDKSSHYASRNRFFFWGIAIVFGFLGFDSAYLGKWGLFLRKLIDGSIFGGCLYDYIKNYAGYSALGAAVYGIFIVAMSLFVILPWGTTLYNYAFKGSTMMSEGIDVPAKDYLDWFRHWIPVATMPNANRIITEDFGYSTMSASDLHNKFELLYKSTLDMEEKLPNKNPWIKSFFLGNAITGGIGYNFINLLSKLPGLKLFLPSSETVERSYSRVAEAAAAPPVHIGGAYSASKSIIPLSTEAKILGSAIIAIITGGGLKGLVDYLIKE